LLCTPNGLAENDEYRELSWTAHNAVPGVLVVGGADDLTAGTQRQFAREAGEFGLEIDLVEIANLDHRYPDGWGRLHPSCWRVGWAEGPGFAAILGFENVSTST
jgi:hypothetical protein